MSNTNCVLELVDVYKAYKQGKQNLEVLSGVIFAFMKEKLQRLLGNLALVNLLYYKLLDF